MQQNEKILHLVHEIATAGAANKRDDIMMGAYLAAITHVIKAERNDGDSPKGMADISDKRLKL